MGHFFEESAANVFAFFEAVDVLVAELQVVGYHIAQTVQSVRKELSAFLEDRRKWSSGLGCSKRGCNLQISFIPYFTILLI